MKLIRVTERRKDKYLFLKEYITNNYKRIICLIFFLIIGIIAGVVFINNAKDEDAREISNNVNSIENAIYNQVEIDNGKLLLKCLKQNIILILTIWILGSMVIGVSLIFALISYKGFCFGYTIAGIMAVLEFKKSIVMSIILLLPKNLIIIPAMILSSVSGINLYKNIIKDRRKQTIKIEIIRHSLICSISLMLMIVAAFCEAYITPFLLNFFKSFL